MNKNINKYRKRNPNINTFDWGSLAAKDKAKNPWNYADDIDTTLLYMNQKNWLGISKKNNPFSKGNIGNTMMGVGSAVGSTLSSMGSIAGGGATNTAGDVLGGLSSVASAIPGPVGAIAGAALGAASFIANGFTDTVNEQYAGQKGSEIAGAAGQISLAQDANSLLADANSMRKSIDLGDISLWGSKGIFIRDANSARRKAYNKALDATHAMSRIVDSNISNTANNINLNRLDNFLENYAALGGPLEVALANEYSNANTMKASNINSFSPSGNMFNNNNINNPFAFGGNIFGNGSNFTTGMIHINNGDTHEANPYEGVPMGADEEGTPNLVEENETVYNDYVYSNRLTVPVLKFNSKDKSTQEQKILRKYKGLTYADAAKKAEKLSGVNERPNDSIAKQGFEYELQILANSQEKEREILSIDDNIEGAKEQKQMLRNMSDEEFVARKQQQEEAQAQQEQLNAQQEQLIAMLQLAGIDPQLFALMSPEQQQQVIALIQQLTQLQPNTEEVQAMLQLVVQQSQPQMAYGGVFANGGQMSPEELQAAQAQELLQQQEQQQDVQQLALSDLVNLLNLTTDLPLTEEAPKLELTGIDSGTPANEMSTSELNETIDLIYLYAKTNGIKELAKRARKAKRASRESKEDFVDDALEDIEDYEQLKSTQQLEQELLNKENQLATSQELIALELAQQAAQELNAEEQASAELNTQMQLPLQYANGGLMSDDLIKAMQLMASYYSQYLLKTNPKAYEALNTEFALYAQLNLVPEEELPILQIQYLASRALLDLQFMQILKQQNSQYALGGSMSLNNADGGNTTDNNNKVFAGTPIKSHKTYGKVNATNYRQFLKYLQDNELSLEDFKTYYKLVNNGNEWTRKNYNSTDANNWITAVNRNNQHEVARQYLDNLDYRLLTSLADAMGIDISDIANDTNRDNSYREAILNNNSDYTKYQEVLQPKALTYRDDEYIPTWSSSPTLKVKGNTIYSSKFFTGDNAQSNLDTYYEKRLADFLKANNIPGYTANGKVKSSFHLTGALARAFNDYLNNTEGDDAVRSKELAKMFRMSHSSDATWDNTANWEYKNKFTPNGTILENSDYRAYYSDSANGGLKANSGKLDSQWGRLHSPKLNFLYEETPVKERTAYYVDGKEIDPTEYLDENGTWNNPSWLATATDDLYSDDGSTVTHRYNLTLAKLPTVTVDDSNNNNNQFTQDKYPIPSTAPLYGVALGLAGLALANMLTPIDTTYGDALISAARTAGLYTPVSATPLGNYLKYTPYDINYVNNQANANNLAAIRLLLNASNGNTGALMAGLLALNYNYGLGIGLNYRLAMEYNDLNKFKVAEFNRATDQYNSEAGLKAAMANQDARSKANQLILEGTAKGYAMNQAAKDAKQSAINAGLSGAALMMFNAYQLSMANKQAAWRLNHLDRLGNYRFDANGNPLEYDTTTGTWKRVASTGGKLRTKRNRGISF